MSHMHRAVSIRYPHPHAFALVFCLSLLLGLFSTGVTAQSILVPSGATGTYQTSEILGGYNGAQIGETVQILYTNAQLGSAAGQTVYGVQFRMSTQYSAAVGELDYCYFKIEMATTASTTLSSTTFASNQGSPTTVMNRKLMFPAGSYDVSHGAGSTNNFGPFIAFDTSYTLPASGSLVMTIRHSQPNVNVAGTYSQDCQGALAGTQLRIADDPFATTSTFSTTEVAVIQFSTAPVSINPTPPTLTPTSMSTPSVSPTTATAGATVTISSTVKGCAGQNVGEGSIQFMADSQTLCTIASGSWSGNTATCTSTTISPGTHSVKAQYLQAASSPNFQNSAQSSGTSVTIQSPFSFSVSAQSLSGGVVGMLAGTSTKLTLSTSSGVTTSGGLTVTVSCPGVSITDSTGSTTATSFFIPQGSTSATSSTLTFTAGSTTQVASSCTFSSSDSTNYPAPSLQVRVVALSVSGISTSSPLVTNSYTPITVTGNSDVTSSLVLGVNCAALGNGGSIVASSGSTSPLSSITVPTSGSVIVYYWAPATAQSSSSCSLSYSSGDAAYQLNTGGSSTVTPSPSAIVLPTLTLSANPAAFLSGSTASTLAGDYVELTLTASSAVNSNGLEIDLTGCGSSAVLKDSTGASTVPGFIFANGATTSTIRLYGTAGSSQAATTCTPSLVAGGDTRYTNAVLPTVSAHVVSLTTSPSSYSAALYTNMNTALTITASDITTPLVLSVDCSGSNGAAIVATSTSTTPLSTVTVPTTGSVTVYYMAPSTVQSNSQCALSYSSGDAVFSRLSSSGGGALVTPVASIAFPPNCAAPPAAVPSPQGVDLTVGTCKDVSATNSLANGGSCTVGCLKGYYSNIPVSYTCVNGLFTTVPVCLRGSMTLPSTVYVYGKIVPPVV